MGSVENVRPGRNQKSTRKLPRRVSEMSKEVLEATLRKKRECNTKALQIVERLIENTVDEEWFIDCLKFISDNHFQDVIEERVINKFCGYPLCPRKLTEIRKQQYHISTKVNKVYDITERKNFCSNKCYKASTYLKQQLLTSPLWLRENEEIPKFVLLPVHSTGGGVGEEVDIGQSNPLKEELKQFRKQTDSSNFTSVSDFMTSTLSKLSSNIDKAENNKTKKSQETSKSRDTNNAKEKYSMVWNNSGCNQNEIVSEPCNEIKENSELDKEKICKENSVSSVTNESKIQKVHNSHHFRSTVDNNQELLSNETENKVIYKEITIDGAEKLSESVTDNNDLEDKCTSEQNKNNTDDSALSINDTIKTESPSRKDTSARKKQNKSKKSRESKKQSDLIQPVTSAVIHIEKCLHEWFTFESMCFLFGEGKVKEMVSDKGECIKEYYKAVDNASWDPKYQEQYMSICRRLNIMELEENLFDSDTKVPTKPLPDYSALKEEKKTVELKIKAFYQGKAAYENVNNTGSETDAPLVLPIVDLHAQKCLRRKIVRDRLNRVVPDILRTFGLPCDVTKDIRDLVATFSLEAHNINFQPLEWNLIAMITIKMLSIKDTRLRILLDTEEVTKYVTMMLMVFQQDGGYLDRLMCWLTDLDNLIRKQ